MKSDRFTDGLNKVLERAEKIAKEHGNNWIGVEHVLAAGIEINGSANNFLDRYSSITNHHLTLEVSRPQTTLSNPRDS